MTRFPALKLARQAMAAGGIAPAVLNAANEVAVAAFLAEKIKFTQIPNIVEQTLNQIENNSAQELNVILHADQQSREIARKFLLH